VGWRSATWEVVVWTWGAAADRRIDLFAGVNSLSVKVGAAGTYAVGVACAKFAVLDEKSTFSVVQPGREKLFTSK
jgi:hypothetical protein